MSVIVKDSSGDIWLYCKGADSSILPLIIKGKTQKTADHVTEFSMVRYPVCDNRKTKARGTAENFFAPWQFQKSFFVHKKNDSLILFCHIVLRL